MTETSDNTPPRDAALLHRTYLALIVLGLLGATAGIVASIVTDGFGGMGDEPVFRFVFAPLIVVVVGTLGLLGCAIIAASSRPMLGRGLLALVTVAGAGWTLYAWNPGWADARHGDTLMRCLTTLTVLAVGGALVGHVLLTVRHPAWLVLVARAVAILSGCTALVSIVVLWWPGALDRWGVVTGLTLAGTLSFVAVSLVPAIARQVNRPSRASGAVEREHATLTAGCPRCGFEQRFATGFVRCAECRGALLVEIEEPRCTCGYLLYRLEGETCPECGAAIDEPSRDEASSRGECDRRAAPRIANTGQFADPRERATE